MSDKIIGKERALVLAQMATTISGQDHHAGWTYKDSVERAEDLLLAAENFVVGKYGEYR